VPIALRLAMSLSAHQRGGWSSEEETVLGWKIELIDAGAVKLRKGDRSIELRLYPKR
jgi:hypothetical protein